MSENLHARAEQLIAKERVEGLSQFERDELASHVFECTRCAEHVQQTDQALRSLRTMTIPLPAGLAIRTQFRVRLRAQELQEREPQGRTLWFACAVSWMFGIASAPYVWRLFEWFGQRTGVPKLVWEIGFGLWWSIPALFVVVVLLTEKIRQSSESDSIRPTR